MNEKNIQPILQTLHQHVAVDHRIREVFEKMNDEEAKCAAAGFNLSWFNDNEAGKTYLDVVFEYKNQTHAIQFPVEWLDPQVNLYTVDKSAYRRVF